MRKVLFSAALLASTLIASPAAAVDFSSDISTWQALNPGYSEDQEYGAEFTDIAALTLDDGTMMGFTGPVEIRTVGSSWSTWCCSYTGDVLYSLGATSVTIDMLTAVDAFGFYAEPNPFATYLITLKLADGSSLTQLVDGDAGAKFFGFTGSGVTSMSVSSSVDFAIGDFFVVPGAVPEPATWAMMVLGFGLAGTAMRRRRKSMSVSYA